LLEVRRMQVSMSTNEIEGSREFRQVLVWSAEDCCGRVSGVEMYLDPTWPEPTFDPQ